MTKTPLVHPTIGFELIRKLAEEGLRIFTIDQAKNVANIVGIKNTYLNEVLYHLTQLGWLIRIQKGLYSFSSTLPGINAVHEFEIAMAIANPAAISYWSALHYHGLTEQIPQRVFILTTSSHSVPRNSKLGGITYQFIKVKPERYFGVQKFWVSDVRVTITDPERTLLDGLMKPQYCGDFSEVMHAFEVYLPKLKLDRIINYALKLDTVVAKRLGWVLKHYGVPLSKLKKLAALPIKGYRPLDPTRPKKGPCCQYWSIQENLSGTMFK
jgi:predicted transcriptional regulator of viral defense system